ncbi:Catalytic beta propeller domain of bacteriophage endosialidase [Rhizobium sp. NFR12]|nr:Catalytic beta propeller domain of bacteriophage endosialidase [Rhizobium sp. NFR12]
MIVTGIVAGATFSLVSDYSSAAILANAEAAAARAETAQEAAEAAAAGIHLPAGAPNRMLVNDSAGTNRERQSVGEVANLLNLDRSIVSFGASGDGKTLDDAAVRAALATGKVLDGRGLTYKVSARPPSFKNIRNAAFKVGSVLHPSRDFLRTDTAKITNGLQYGAWAQDKAYKIGDQLRVWVNEKQSHGDGTSRIALYFSDDGGSSWSFGEYLAMKASGDTLWSAGFDGVAEYLFVRVPVYTTENPKGNDVPPYNYQLWKRILGVGAAQDYNAPWTKINVTFPTIPGWTGQGTQPVMVHSFSKGHDDSIVVGASYQEGAAVLRSADGGVTWTAHILAAGNTFEEPTVRYVPSLGIYCGFMRFGGSGNPRWWISEDNFATPAQWWTAPPGFFGPAPLASSTVSFDVDPNGNFHAVTAYRNGVVEGVRTDDRTTTFYLTGPVVPGSIWTNPPTKLFALGQMQRREHDGASALGQGSVIATSGKVHLFYGMEGRTGVRGGLGAGNRVTDIFQTVVFLDDKGSLFDERTELAANRGSFSPLRKVSGIDAWAIPNTDARNWGPIILSGRTNHFRNLQTMTLLSGTLTLSGTRSGLYIIDTEGSAAGDNLSSIVDPDAVDGDIITMATSTGARDVTVKHSIGNILCGSDKVLDGAADKITLMYFGGNWHMVSFADNGD